MTPTTIDLYAGPGLGGWDEGLRSLGVTDVVGIEWDAAACLTRAAAGHATIRADVTTYPTFPFAGRVTGLVASPPCQAFSLAGKGGGRRDIARLLAHVAACRDGWAEPDPHGWEDPRSTPILQVLRWVWDLRPAWVACEQVPQCLPVWRAMLAVLRGWGYDGYASVLCAADYGVPQTRRRAFLVAARDRPVVLPEVTHVDPRKGGSLLHQPWVSMADALGWGLTDGPAGTVVSTSDGGPRGLDGGAGSRKRYREAQAAGRWAVRTGQRTMRHSRDAAEAVHYDRPVDEPAPTVDGKAATRWRLRLNNQANAAVRDLHEPASTIYTGYALNSMQWVAAFPSTTVAGTPRVDSITVEVCELAVLQGFPPDYPFQGTKTAQATQVGNAVPPPMAAAVLATLFDAGEAVA